MTGTMPTPAPLPGRRAAPVEVPTFAHASEAELARILDFYQVRWLYEPHVFPILWNLEGSVVESFSPDFYLPDLDLYVELTTLRQPLVRKKNRKLRRLRELYPDIRIKLFYARDFRALMLKYGKFGVVDALSGSSGQVVAIPIPLDEDDQPIEAVDAIEAIDAIAAGVDPAVIADAVVVADRRPADDSPSTPIDPPGAPLADLVPLRPRRRRPLRPTPSVARPTRARLVRDR
jgi:hypothetical protein